MSRPSHRSHDVDYPLLQQQQQQQQQSKELDSSLGHDVPKDMIYTFFEGEGDEDVDVAIVTYFDEFDWSPKNSPLSQGEEEGEGERNGENHTQAITEAEQKQLVKLLEEEAEAEEKEALADTVDLFWLQEQIDLLSHFESSLSLDSVHRYSNGHGRRGCNKKMKHELHNRANHQSLEQQQQPIMSGEDRDVSEFDSVSQAMDVLVSENEDGSSYIAVFWDQFNWDPETFWISGGVDEAGSTSMDGLPVYHPSTLVVTKEEQVQAARLHHSSRDIGVMVLSIIITCLYCVVVFGAIYLVLRLVNSILVSLWICMFGGCGSGSNSNGTEEDENESENENENVAEDSIHAPLLGGGHLVEEELYSDSALDTHVNPLSLLQPLGPEPATGPTYVDLTIEVVQNPSYTSR